MVKLIVKLIVKLVLIWGQSILKANQRNVINVFKVCLRI